MPELPEVETIRRGLSRAVLGKTIKKVTVNLPKIIALGPEAVSNVRKANRTKAKLFESFLRGQKIVQFKRRSKVLIFDFAGPYHLLIHLKMTGQLIFAKPGERKKAKIMNLPNSKVLELPHKYTHVIFEFRGGSKLFFNDLRQFGYLKLVKKNELAEVKELSAYGPEPFSQEFNLEYLMRKAQSRPKLSIKQFLLDPKVVAGIGNIYSDEILYWSKIRPARKLRSLNSGEWRAISKNIPRVLREATKAHGSSVGDFFKVDGTEGTYGRAHRVYGRGGEKCKRCGSVISTIKLGGRTSSYCPTCQS